MRKPDANEQARLGVTDGVRHVLDTLPPHLQPAAALWITEEGLKALAFTHGPERAAMAAYRLADILATGRRAR